VPAVALNLRAAGRALWLASRPATERKPAESAETHPQKEFFVAESTLTFSTSKI